MRVLRVDGMTETEQVRLMLSEVYTAEGVEQFMRGKNRRFGGESPNDLIAAGRGEWVLEEVRRFVGQANDGVFT
jgi:hypothetical protein